MKILNLVLILVYIYLLFKYYRQLNNTDKKYKELLNEYSELNLKVDYLLKEKGVI